MGLFNSIMDMIGKGVAKGVGDVVEKAVAEAVKPAAAKLAKKQADLIDSVTRDIEKANESMKEAEETVKQQDPEELKRAMEMLRRSAENAAKQVENLEAEKTLTDEEVLAQWETLLPDFPKWECGGNHYSIEEDKNEDFPCVRFYLDAAEASWLAYRAVLVANGFRQKFRSQTDFWYKEVDGRYPIVHLFHIDYEACEMELVFGYDTKEEIEEAIRL